MTRNAAVILGMSVFALTAFGSAPAALARPHLPSAAILQNDGADGSATTGGAADGGTPDSGNSDDSADSATDPRWTPNLSLLKGMHSFKVGEYPLPLPSGMTMKKQQYHDEHLVGSTYEWLGSKHSPYPGVMIIAGILRCRPGYFIEEVGTEQMDVIDMMEARMVDVEQDVTKADKQEGEVNGLTVTRNYFKFTFTKSGVKAHGFLYDTVTNNEVIMVGALAPEPINAKDLPIAEAISLRFLQTVAKHQ